MDQTQLQQQIATFYAKLPSDVQATFASMTWLETLRSISTKYNLTENQISVLGTETTLAFLGITSMQEYEEMLVKDLSLPKEVVDKMITEIDTSIFKAIRPQLESTYNTNISDMEKEEGNAMDPKFASLPEDLQKAIAASDYQKKLYDIGTKHKLPISIMAQVEDITVRLLMGSISASQYENELSIATDLNATKTREVATDVNNDIIMGIREYMKIGGQTEAKKEIISTIDEVPRPPYAQAGMVDKPMPKAEQGIYEKAGIEFVEDFKDTNKGMENKEEKSITGNESNVLSVSGIDMMQNTNQVIPEHITSNKKTQKEMLEGIENPVSTPSSIIGDKLTSMTASSNTVSDYTLPKIASSKPEEPQKIPKKLDPYKEQI